MTERRQPVAHPEFGVLLARLREARGLAQNHLARSAELDPSSVSRIEKGERGVSREVVERLGDALDATPEERVRLLQASGFLPAVVASLLGDADLARLAALFRLPDLEPRHRDLLLQHVRLALAHAHALGYDPPDPWAD